MSTYHVIPHTHWDREWYLSFDAFRVRLVHMMDDLLDILRERQEYRGFLLDGQTIVLDDYLEIRPERYDEIAEHVRSDRLWTGPWYVLPDNFLVSGEALVRNLMRGRANAKKLGGTMNVGYIPDSFGHTAQIPQILRGFKMDAAVVWRGFGGEPGQEASEYRWRSPDGSEVLMEHLTDLGYSGAYFESPDEQHVEARFEPIRRRVDARARTPERLVLSGGDHHWPVRHLPEVIGHLAEANDGPARVVHSSPGGFFDALKKAADGLDLPVVEGELRFGYRWAFNVTGGVYSSRMYLKQANASGQRLLERYLEPMNALTVLAGGRSQQALIDHGWSYLLQNHPHDSICGCSIDPVHREMMTRFEKLAELGSGVDTFAWMSLAPGSEGSAGDDRTLTFFNPSPFPRSEVVECDVSFFRQDVLVGLNPDAAPDQAQPPVGLHPDAIPVPAHSPVALNPDATTDQAHSPLREFVLLDAENREVPFEVVNREEGYDIAYTRYGYPAQTRVDRFSLQIPMDDLPPMGLRELRVERRPGTASNPDDTALSATDRSVENAHIRVEVRDDGTFLVTDKSTGTQFGPLGYFEDGADAGDEYNYSPPPRDRVLRSTDSAAIAMRPVGGRYRKGLRVEGNWAVPAALTDNLMERSSAQVNLAFATTAWLTAHARHVTFETTIDNTAEDHRLRVVFETGRRTNRHYADNAFAIITREQQAYDPAEFPIEVPAAVSPMHRFVIVEDDAAGAAVFADGLPEYELKHDSNGEIALTLLRCVGQLARGNLLTRPGGRAGWHNETPEAQCPGCHTFRYAFMPLASQWPQQMPRINAAAESLLLPVRWRAGKGADPLREDRSALRIDPPTLILSAFKEAEDGESILLRIYNPTGETVEGAVHFEDEVSDLRRADLEETPGDLLARRTGTVHDTWSPYRIHTYRYQPDKNYVRRSV